MDFNPFSPLVALINDKLFFALEVDLITKKEFGYLIVDFNTQTFYIIPEILKDERNPPGRPIVSLIWVPLEKISKYIDSLIKGLVLELPSYVRDTGDVLNKILDRFFPGDLILMGIDVESLSTSKPHKWGLMAVFYFLDSRFLVLGAQNEFILNLLELALKNNLFQFTGSYTIINK